MTDKTFQQVAEEHAAQLHQVALASLPPEERRRMELTDALFRKIQEAGARGAVLRMQQEEGNVDFGTAAKYREAETAAKQALHALIDFESEAAL